jgi:hypothetical protein
MNLPNLESAVVSEDKIVGYLLNPAHPEGAGKAKFFLSVGFDADQWYLLATALLKMVETWPVVDYLESVHGAKYIVDGQIVAPGGAPAEVRTVWIVDRGAKFPRLVTAYPRMTEK